MSTAPHTWPRLFVADALQDGAALTLGEEQSHYLAQVMRARQGDPVRLFNGRDGEWRATLARLPNGRKNGALLQLEEQRRPQAPEPGLWLCAAPIKRQHFDFSIQKATELGVAVIQPILTARTQVRDVNVERCRAIAIEAAEQSERLSIPEIREARPLGDLLASWPATRLAVLCAEAGEAHPIGKAFATPLALRHDAAAFFVGPEGGFEGEEMARIRALPASLSVRLGPRILRADTAALAALACWQAARGDWMAVRERS